MESEKIFNNLKEQVESINPTCELDCLREIEINISNVCNLKCPFCPHSLPTFKYESNMMSVETAELLAKQLSDINYKGSICIAGYGEPTLNPNIYEIINILKDFNVSLITNGVPLRKDEIEKIGKMCLIKVSVHHWDMLPMFKEKFENTNVIYRNHDMQHPEMNVYNRNGMFEKLNNYGGACYYPYYQVMIDYDGCYLQCNADWQRKSKTEASLYNTHIRDWFVGNQLKKDMLKGRENCKHCCCDINGKMIGEKFFRMFNEF